MPFPVPGRIADMLRRSTVQIRASGSVQGSASGIALNNGTIVTNAHVAVDDQPWVETWDGVCKQARVVKRDRRRDLALLSVRELPLVPAIFASAPAIPRQPVIAVGNPLGFTGAVSTGTIYANGLVSGLGNRHWIQSNVKLAPGNSGGPLASIQGEIVGMNTMILNNRFAGSLALSIPVDAMQAFLSSDQQPRSLGVVVRPVWVRPGTGRPQRFGLILLTVEAEGPADRASLLPGDTVIAAAGKALESPDDLYDAISLNERLPITFLRGRSTNERQVTVQLAPNREAIRV